MSEPAGKIDSAHQNVIRQQNVALLCLHQQICSILRMFPLMMVFVGCCMTWATYSSATPGGPSMTFWNTLLTLMNDGRLGPGRTPIWIVLPWLVFTVCFCVCVLAEGSIAISPRRADPMRMRPSAPNRWLSIVLPIALLAFAIMLGTVEGWRNKPLLDVTFAPTIAILGAIVYIALSWTRMDVAGLFVRLPESGAGSASGR